MSKPVLSEGVGFIVSILLFAIVAVVLMITLLVSFKWKDTLLMPG
ncbi:MAG: hypothetical protein ABIX01_07010 [Chitinophagaceae bacterium]